MIKINLLHPPLPPRCPFRYGDLVQHRVDRRKALVIEILPRFADIKEVHVFAGNRFLAGDGRWGSVHDSMVRVRFQSGVDTHDVPWAEYDLVKRPGAGHARPGFDERQQKLARDKRKREESADEDEIAVGED